MIEIIEEKAEWNALLEELGKSDFYHSYDYHSLDKKSNDRPIIIKYTEGNVIIALPLLVRQIPGTNFYDATSVYGYSGPVSKNVNGYYDNQHFRKELEEVFQKNNIISVFTRLNPFVPNQLDCLQNIGEISNLGQVINIDLTLDLETQYGQYRKRYKSYINKSKKLCTIKKVFSDEDLETFIRMYYETMKRVNASPYYFFSKDYFKRLIESTDFTTEVLLSIDKSNGIAIAGALFVKKHGIVQYHLSGAKEAYLHLNPIKFLIDYMRVQSAKEGNKVLNLGGGVGASEDSLFKFKSGFSKDVRTFFIWKYICSPTSYRDIVDSQQPRLCASLNTNCHIYFPCYRCTISKEDQLSKL